MALQCPYCQARVYSRRHRLCTCCHTELPGEFLYSFAELEAVEAEERERELQTKLREQRRRAEWEARLGDPGGGGP